MTVHKLVIPDWDSHDDDTAPPDRPSHTAPHCVVRRVESRYARRSSTSKTAPANQLSLIDFDPTHVPEHLCGDIVSASRVFGSGDELNVVKISNDQLAGPEPSLNGTKGRLQCH